MLQRNNICCLKIYKSWINNLILKLKKKTHNNCDLWSVLCFAGILVPIETCFYHKFWDVQMWCSKIWNLEFFQNSATIGAQEQKELSNYAYFIFRKVFHPISFHRSQSVDLSGFNLNKWSYRRKVRYRWRGRIAIKHERVFLKWNDFAKLM